MSYFIPSAIPLSRQKRLQRYIKRLPNLVAYYPLNETTGSAAFNRAPSTIGTLDGTISGATIGQPGKVGRAYSFDGVNDKIVLDHASLNSIPSGGNFTIFLLANKLTNTGPKAGLAFAGTDDLILYPSDNEFGNAGQFRVFWRDVGGSLITQTGINNSGAWHSFCFASYGDADHRGFVDGVQIGSSTTSRGSAGPFGSALNIGGWNDASQFFDGFIQHVAIFTSALSQAQILKITRIAGLA